MLSPRKGTRVLALGAASSLAIAAYHRFVRPHHLRWGATPAEAVRAFPGDATVARPHTVSTRAVTIDASPAQVWPWLVQLGAGRGGLYSYDWLDNLFGYTSGASAETILPAYQDLAVGDVIPLGRGPSWPVTVVAPERALVFEPVEGQVSWCFALDTDDGESTRLVSRVRVASGWRPATWLLAPALDVPWLLMERKMLLGIKRRAESPARSSSA